MTGARSEERIARLRALSVAIESGDRDGFRAAVRRLLHPDGEWTPLITAVEGRGYRGPDGMVAFFDDFVGSFEVSYRDVRYEPVGDDAVLFLTVLEVRGSGSGLDVERELGVIFEFDGDLVRRARAYDSHVAAAADAEALIA